MPKLDTRLSPLEPVGPLQVSGVVFFSVETAEHLLATHVSPPLDACTYMGLDSGAQPVKVTKGRQLGPLARGEMLCDLRLVFFPFWVSISADANSYASYPHLAVSIFRHPALHGSECEQGELPGWAAPGDGAR